MESIAGLCEHTKQRLMNVPGRSQSNRTREVSFSHQKEFQSFSYKEYKAGGGGRLKRRFCVFLLSLLP